MKLSESFLQFYDRFLASSNEKGLKSLINGQKRSPFGHVHASKTKESLYNLGNSMLSSENEYLRVPEIPRFCTRLLLKILFRCEVKFG
jgi:hypothetical protein